MAAGLARGLDYVGVMAVEFFVLRDDENDAHGRIVFNEMAPRPHNSGHYTLDACATDQFQQQVRALCGLPLGDARLLSPVVMVNLLGDVWLDREPHWDELLKHPGVQLHLYGKAEARARPQDGALQLPGRDAGRCAATGARLPAPNSASARINSPHPARSAR